jgi:hypothetical protein
VEATRRISPRLLCELLAVTGEATERYLASLELFAPGDDRSGLEKRSPRRLP